MWQIVQPNGGFGGQEFVPPEERDRRVTDMVFEIYQSIKNSPMSPQFHSRKPRCHQQEGLTSRS